MQLLRKTLKESGFDGIFTEVDHRESLGIKNPHELRMFFLDVVNNAFSYDALRHFLLRNIGRYVFSRARIEQFTIEDDLEIVGAQALGLLRKACKMDTSWIGEELGDVILYVFLEQILGAPKLFSKIELMQFGNQDVLCGGGVHLLPLDNGGTPSYQIIFGKSNIIGDLQDAIDHAFNSIIATRDNATNEMRIVESTILAETYDSKTTDYLKSIIVPSKSKNAQVDRAFGVFLGYSLGLKPSEYSNFEFRRELTRKMDTDIKAHAQYIAAKIKESNLSTHSFYLYILPFNDADGEKASIMNSLLEGGV